MTSFRFTPRGTFALQAAASFAEDFPGTDVDRAIAALGFAWRSTAIGGPSAFDASAGHAHDCP